MNKVFNPSVIEQSCYQQWEQNGYFQASGHGNPFCIILPPPNVTGNLHMGHAFQHTLMDVLIRYHRMSGSNTLWQPGFDHAGIATQMIVERQLEAEGKTRHDLSREDFIQRVWQWKRQSGNTISKQMRRLGVSIDWQRERFTMDEQTTQQVMRAFEKLYDDGLIYRGKRLVNWDPILHTAVSDLEVNNKEQQGHLWHIRYPLVENEKQYIIIATTRPETMLGDVAVAVHPNDIRYRHLIGQQLKLPLTDRVIPIIADEYVDPEFGSGCVKITPAHDFNDYKIGLRHQLECINILTADAHINEKAPFAYQGLERFAARKQIIIDLKKSNLLENIIDHKLQIPYNDRSGAILEPYLTEQWYINTKPLAAAAVEVVEKGKVQFIPDNWCKTYHQWMHNMQDWCISRQLLWGHQIPAWYDDDGNVYVGLHEDAIRKKYNLHDTCHLTRETDVLDTWFSAALWPFAALGWPEKTNELGNFYPTQVLVTGFDIIFFWVARMIMFSLYFTGKVPFYKVYITGLIRDEKGQKMSKSKGNVLDPVDLIEGISLEDLITKRIHGLMQPAMRNKIMQATRKKFPHGIQPSGTDALRFTFCALASTGRNINLDANRLEGYRNFCNKLWNAARFVSIKTANHDLSPAEQVSQTHAINRWILSRLQNTIAQSHKHLEDYRFDLLAQILHEFVWQDYCDWYLEFAKLMLSSSVYAKSTQKILVQVLETLLRLLHPIIPFITEAIWQQIAPSIGIKQTSIMQMNYPQINTNLIDHQAEKEVAWLQDIISKIRRIRAEMGIASKQPFDLIIRRCGENDRTYLAKHQDLLKQLAKIDTIYNLDAEKTLPACALLLSDKLEILIPIEHLVDLQVEVARLNKQIKKLEKDYQRFKKKLNNHNYLNKSPSDVVEQEQHKFEQTQQKLSQLKQQLKQLVLDYSS